MERVQITKHLYDGILQVLAQGTSSTMDQTFLTKDTGSLSSYPSTQRQANREVQTYLSI